MLKRFRKPGELSVAVSSSELFEGDEVKVEVEGSVRRDIDGTAATVTLVRMVEFEYEERTFDHHRNTSTTQTRKERQRHAEAEAPLLSPGTHPGGAPIRTQVVLAVPGTTMGTADGKIVRVSWYVEARIKVSWGRDAVARAPVTVRSAAAAWAAHTEAPPDADARGVADLEFTDLSARSVTAGDTVTGILTVTPLKEASARGARVEFERSERVTKGEGKRAGEVVARADLHTGPLVPGQDLRLPFSLTVPEDVAPSLSGDAYSITWRLRGVVDRKMRRDPVVTLPVHVHTA